MNLMSIGLSGMTAAMTQMSTSAHNIANTQTPNFRRQQVQQEAVPQGALAKVVTLEGEEQGENWATDLVRQKEAFYAFKANAKSVQIASNLLGSLLDDRA